MYACGNLTSAYYRSRDIEVAILEVPDSIVRCGSNQTFHVVFTSNLSIIVDKLLSYSGKTMAVILLV